MGKDTGRVEDKSGGRNKGETTSRVNDKSGGRNKRERCRQGER